MHFINSKNTRKNSRQKHCLHRYRSNQYFHRPQCRYYSAFACNGEGKELFNQLINPGYDIPENEYNITTEMVQGEPLLGHVWDEIHDQLRDADIVLAYSTESDFMYLEKAPRRKCCVLSWTTTNG
ncbi:hypothetical protein THIOSC13_670007 [uncultured Thiomicrorhabdus sp.]